MLNPSLTSSNETFGKRDYIFSLYPVGLASYERCCERKTVGDKSYTLVESGGEVPPECRSSCVYSEDDDPSKMFCFAPGDKSVTCNAWWTPTTMPPGRCQPPSCPPVGSRPILRP